MQLSLAHAAAAGDDVLDLLDAQDGVGTLAVRPLVGQDEAAGDRRDDEIRAVAVEIRDIVARAAIQQIIPAPANQVVVASAAVEGVVAFAVEDQVIPIAAKNLQVIPTDDRVDFDALVEKASSTADLVILGFTEDRLRDKGADLLLRHPSLQDVLFVSAEETIFIE